MADIFSSEERSWIMSRVRSGDTGPEKQVRSVLHRLGYRFRLHGKDLPGKPDIVFSRRKKVIFVHGCFWHRHDCRAGRKVPKTNTEYWTAKIGRNVVRDAEQSYSLREAGWERLVVWECETRDLQGLEKTLTEFLGPAKTD
ncbi:MAG: DNA mismatch endonuclease Vsr [Desulfuromonadales bacterium]